MFFDYFYGNEADQFAFYMVPKMLMLQNDFTQLSSDAKLLYGMMLSRNTLSKKNNWIDEEGRIYIIYTIDAIKEDMHCCKTKAIKMLTELENNDLIIKKRQGQGKPSIIYVMNFSTDLSKELFPAKEIPDLMEDDEPDLSGEITEIKPGKTEEKMKCEKWTSESLRGEKMKCEKWTSRSPSQEKTPQTRINTEKCEKWTSRSVKNGPLEVHFMDPKYKDNKYIYNNHQSNQSNIDIHLRKTDDRDDDLEEKRKEEEKSNLIMFERTDQRDTFTHADLVEEMISDPKPGSLSAEDERMFYDIVDLIKRKVMEKDPAIRIRGSVIGKESARAILLKLRREHVLTVINNLKNIDMDTIRNKDAYMLAALYSALTEAKPQKPYKESVTTGSMACGTRFSNFRARKVDYDELEHALIMKTFME